MNKSLYFKLAFTNIKNNRKTYIPYILTAILTVMMFYIMVALTGNKSVGDGTLQTVLFYAAWVIGIFSVIFLFYTNSFLIKRRKKELGVYNMLGMEKRHIAKMLSVETLAIAVLSIGVGILGGIIFSKLMFLVLLKMIGKKVQIEFDMSVGYAGIVLALFVVIFILTLIYNLMQVQLANPVELLRGSSQGEKEPKTKRIMTIIGILMIGAGYYIALVTETPLEAIQLFFIAVICVIIGTYALFTAGSIALLKILRRNKNFYYKTKHFTSVSGMIYRMKQNAAGLANICILSTMVLVIVSSTVSLYLGMEDILDTRFPKQFALTNYNANEDSVKQVQGIIKEALDKEHVKIKDGWEHHQGSVSTTLKDDKFVYLDEETYVSGDVCEMNLIPLDDYNAMENKNITLSDNEILVYDTGGTYGKKDMQIGTFSFAVKEELKQMKLEKKGNSNIVKTYYIIMKDIPAVQSLLKEAYAGSGLPEELLVRNSNVGYDIRFDLTGKESNGTRAIEEIRKQTGPMGTVYIETRAGHEESFYMLYGGLLFIGIYLGIMFLMATVLIIYYKQISEGYDDKERFQIMQKVGMSKREVRSSIRSQILTVFYLPLVVAVIHIAVSFKVITKLLAMLNLVNVPLFLTCTIVTVIVFIIFYAVVFAITAREYYKIVD